MPRLTAWLLVAVLVSGLLVALLPSGRGQARGQVVLRGIQLQLFPQQDPAAVWIFSAHAIVYHPSRGISDLVGLSQGERLVHGRLDMTIRTTDLSVDSTDNLRAQTATLYLPKLCTSVQLGSPGNPIPVVIDQQTGFSGPDVYLTAPDYTLTAKSIRASFDLKQTSSRDPRFLGTLKPTKTCRDGHIVPTGGSS